MSTVTQGDMFYVAARSDFLRTIDRAALDATIAAGLELRHPEPPIIQTYFAIVRRALLHGTTNIDQLNEIARWNSNIEGRRFYYEWTPADVFLIRATAASLVEASRPLGASYVVDLKYVRSIGDPYLRGEAGLILAKSLLKTAAPHPKTGGVLNRARTAAANLLGGIDRGRMRKAAISVLEEVLQDEIYGCVTLPRSRVRLAEAWLGLDEPAKALQALDPRRSEPEWPGNHNHDAPGTDAILKVESIGHLVQEGATSAVRSKRRNAYTRALDTATSLSTAALEPADTLRLAQSLDQISRDHPESKGSWHAGNLLYQLCPDPTKTSVTPELAFLMHLHYLNRYRSSHQIRYITNAYLYIDAAFAKLPNDSPEKLSMAGDWLRTSFTYTGATSLETKINVFPALDYLDKFLRRNDPKRMAYLSIMGMALSRAHKHGDHSDRLVGYWEEHLTLAQEAARRNELTPELLARALENAAISLIYRSHTHMNDVKDLAKALQLSRRAFDLVGYSDRLRTPLTYASTLEIWSRVDGSPDARQEAIQVQTEALRRARAQKSVHGTNTSDRGTEHLPGLLEMTFPVSSAESFECSDSLKWLQVACLDDDYADLVTSLAWATKSCQHALASGDWDYAPRIVSKALNRVELTLSHVENPAYALYYIQGLSSIGAVALTHRGSPTKAVEVLERGAALRARIQLERQNTKKTQTITDVQLKEGRPPMTPRRFESSREIQGLSTTLDGPIVYLAATAQTGLALVVTPQSCRSVWLPELTTSNVDRWLDLTSADKKLNEKARGVPVRGARGEASPGRAAVDEVIAAATAAVAPLENVLSSLGAHLSAHVIPVGQTAGIPWTYVLSHPVTINPSATLLNRSRTRPVSSGPRIAITAPNPCHYKEESLPDLWNAREEGSWLADNVGFDNTATGSAATRSAFNKALNAGPEVLHIAAHGFVDTNSWGDVAHLLWTDNPSTRTAETTALPELNDLNVTDVGTVFLAACWGGAPNRILPDESISFPTAFLTAGARSVIAPLWPIDDDVAYEFVTAFYEFWKLDDLNPALALKQAAAEIRDAHPDSSTWAAFMLTGHI